MTGGLDPTQVPAFPLYTLSITSNPDTVTLDGVVVQVDEGFEAVTVGKAAVQARIQSHNLRAVRVVVIDRDTNDRWNMIVGSDGEVVDLTEMEREAALAQARRSRRLKFLAITTGALLVVGAGTAITLASLPKPTPAPIAYQLQGVGATPPAAVPPSFAATAAWAQPVAAESTVTLGANGVLLTNSAAGYLEGLDPKSGEVIWRGDSAPDDLSAVRLTHWGGTEVYAAATTSKLQLWPTSVPTGQASVQPTEIALPTGSDPHLDGAQPFIPLGDWYVAVPSDGAFKNVQIPPGSTPVNVTTEGNIVAISHEKVLTLSPEGKVISEQGYTAPKGTTRMPEASTVLDNEHVLLTWKDSSSATGILNLKSGALTTAPAGAHTRDEGAQLIDTTTKTAVIGTLAVDFGDRPGTWSIRTGFKPVSLHGRTIYGTTSDGPATLNVNRADSAPTPWNAYTNEDQAPAVITDDAAYIVGTQLEQSTLYRVNRSGSGRG